MSLSGENRAFGLWGKRVTETWSGESEEVKEENHYVLSIGTREVEPQVLLIARPVLYCRLKHSNRLFRTFVPMAAVLPYLVPYAFGPLLLPLFGLDDLTAVGSPHWSTLIILRYTRTRKRLDLIVRFLLLQCQTGHAEMQISVTRRSCVQVYPNRMH
jgi:hypothetical protein